VNTRAGQTCREETLVAAGECRYTLLHDPGVAQLVEQPTVHRRGAGSIPAPGVQDARRPAARRAFESLNNRPSDTKSSGAFGVISDRLPSRLDAQGRLFHSRTLAQASAQVSDTTP
jgi:hypothetical protein